MSSYDSRLQREGTSVDRLDIDQFRLLLADYRTSLERHADQLQRTLDMVHVQWRALDAVYGGSRAADLGARWNRTARWFDDYIAQTRRLLAFLEERKTHLREM